jgi:hypothetical protein
MSMMMMMMMEDRLFSMADADADVDALLSTLKLTGSTINRNTITNYNINEVF